MADGDAMDYKGMGAKHFTDGDKHYFHQQFVNFDKEKNDTIALADVSNALRMCGQHPTEEEVKKIEADLDDGSNTVTFESFLDGVFANCVTLKTVDDLKEAFRAFDPELRGVISQNDLRYLLTSMGDRFNDEEMNEFILEVQSECDTEGGVLYESLAMKLLPEFLK
jgi:calmodulin